MKKNGGGLRRRAGARAVQGRRTRLTNDSTLLLLVLGIVLLTLNLQGLPVFRAIENSLYDARVRMLASQYVTSSDIIVVAIDEDSLSALEPAVGRWPWPRAVLASVVDYCSAAKVIGLDILFPEGDWQYRQSDALFVKAVAEQGRVINAIYLDRRLPQPPLSESLTPLALSHASWQAWPPAETYGGVLAPFPALLKASAGAGHVNAEFGADGVSRRHAVVAKVGKHVFPSFALAAVMKYKGLAPRDIRWEGGSVHVGQQHEIPIDSQGRFRICASRWRYKSYRIVDVIRAWQAEGEGKTPPLSRDTFKNKIVLVGSLATGLLEDKQATPLSSQTGGVEIITAAIDDILRGIYVRTVPGSALFLVALLALFPANRRLARPLVMLAASLLLAVFFCIVSIAALFSLSWILPMTGPLLGLVLSCALLSSVFWHEERRQRGYVEERERTRQELTDMVVHDLRNALTPVVTALSIAEETDDGEFVRNIFLPIVKDSSDLLLCQIESMLDIRLLQEGHLVIRRSPQSILRIVDSTVREYVLVAERADLTVDLQIDRLNDAAVEVDNDIVKRVLRNLLWNAIKFSVPGGSIQVALIILPRHVEIHVRNRCETIPVDEQAQLFEAFRTGRQSGRSKAFHSSGLGLTFCKMAAEAHGGSIRLVSPCPVYEGEDGVEFTVSLPRNA